jgi:hypothetical protein
MPLREDIAEGFQKKGLKFVSLNESTADPEKTTLLYVDATGKNVNKEINMRLSELQDTLTVLEAMDPEDMATYLLE